MTHYVGQLPRVTIGYICGNENATILNQKPRAAGIAFTQDTLLKYKLSA